MLALVLVVLLVLLVTAALPADEAAEAASAPSNRLTGAAHGDRPGIRRLGKGLVNVYLLEEAGEITIVDTGAPGYWKELPSELAAMGRTMDDVRALLLTHAHSDHIGFAERIRRERRSRERPPGRCRAGARRGEAGARQHGRGTEAGASAPSRASPPSRSRTGCARDADRRGRDILDGAMLDVPGAPRVIHVPGHTAGSVAFHAPARDASSSATRSSTRNVITGRRDPTSRPSSMPTTAGGRLAATPGGLAASFVLPGHGDAWRAASRRRSGGPQERPGRR